MQKETMLALICLGFCAMIVLSIYFIMKYRSIVGEQNIITDIPKRKPWDWQKPGIVVLGIGLGIFIVGVLTANHYIVDNDSINFGIIVICTGISMIVANKLDKNNSVED